MVSVIIPTYNEFKNTQALIYFFEKEIKNCSDIEIIFVDSPLSNDNISTIVQKQKYLLSPKSGRSHQLNYGASMAKGDILCFLHADVRPPISFIRDILNAVEKGFEFGFFAYRFDPSTTLLNFNARFTHRKGMFAGGGDQIHFIRKNTFKNLGGYNTDFCIMEDFDLMRRIKKAGLSYTIISKFATVSSRKYTYNSWLKVNFWNMVAFLMFKLKINPIAIKKVYNSRLNLV
jgi:glycosyltransferase involved in cell wall biosynthesis